jgi:hypothetical protein
MKKMSNKQRVPCKNKYFVKRNICPYCTYPCDSAAMIDIDGDDKPEPGSINFCLMCCEPSTWDENMKLVKFDLNYIEDIIERNRIKLLGIRINEFWETNPDKSGRRAMYLKRMDQRCR